VAPNSSDLELLQALKAGQISALERLYDCYGDAMYGLAFKILTNRQEAEDLIQEIFLKVWRNCTYDPARGSFKSFLMLLVHSRAIDRLRSRNSRLNTLEHLSKKVEMPQSINLPLEEAMTDELSQRVQAALCELPEKQRQALEMAYYQGLTQVEISQRLNVPVGTVKSWFRLSFKKLRQLLQDLIP
jgi:RNA polymerase sigma-70 factor (ECF subfamily)